MDGTRLTHFSLHMILLVADTNKVILGAYDLLDDDGASHV